MRLIKTEAYQPPRYSSASEFRDKAEKYFKRLDTWLKANPNHNVKLYEDPEHLHYRGYCTLRKGWEIRQPEVDALNARIQELEDTINKTINIGSK